MPPDPTRWLVLRSELLRRVATALIGPVVLFGCATRAAARLSSPKSGGTVKREMYQGKEVDEILYPQGWQAPAVESGNVISITHYDTRQVKVNTAEIEKPENYRITSAEDQDFRTAVAPKRVGHLSILYKLRPSWAPFLRHTVFLVLPASIITGCAYTVEVGNLTGGTYRATLRFDEKKTLNLNIKANHYGFLPDAGRKYAYLGRWAGTLGAVSFANAKRFIVVEAKTGREVFAGEPKLRHRHGVRDEDHHKVNLSGEDVYELEFSELRRQGEYFIYVPGLGRSYGFRIGEDVYAEPFRVAMRGLLHQRCGMELKMPFTRWKRGACHRKPVELTTLDLYDCGTMGLAGGKLNAFRDLPRMTTGEKSSWWGGYHDAADYDRRSQHIRLSGRLLDFYELAPRKFYDGQLGLPESGDGIPDIVNEARWNMDFWTRLQDPGDGGVRGGIESERHPDFHEGPMNDPLHLYAYAKDERSSLFYAAVAAQLSRVYRSLGKQRDADLFLDRARKAWDYAQQHRLERWGDDRAWAAAELFKTTGEKVYNEAFLRFSVFSKDKNSQLEVWPKYNQHRASWAYATCERPGTDAAVREGCRRGHVGWAKWWLANARTIAYRFGKYPTTPLGGWSASLGVPYATEVFVKAYVVSGEGKYRDWALLNNDFFLGGRPLNMIFTTGMGHRSVTDPWHIPQLHDGIPEPPPGIAPCGPADAKRAKDYVGKHYYPAVEQWPCLYNWPGGMSTPEFGEFTPQGSIAPTAAAYAFFLPDSPAHARVSTPRTVEQGRPVEKSPPSREPKRLKRRAPPVTPEEHEPSAADRERRRRYMEAETALIDGDFDKAKELFRAIVEESPDSEDAKKAKEYLDVGYSLDSSTPHM